MVDIESSVSVRTLNLNVGLYTLKPRILIRAYFFGKEEINKRWSQNQFPAFSLKFYFLFSFFFRGGGLVIVSVTSFTLLHSSKTFFYSSSVYYFESYEHFFFSLFVGLDKEFDLSLFRYPILFYFNPINSSEN